MPRGLAPPPREVARIELLDEPGVSAPELAGNLDDLRRLNRLGPTRSILSHAWPLEARAEPGRPLHVLDVGAGGGDLAVAVVRRARRAGRAVRVIGVDLSPAVLARAARAIRDTPEVRLVAGDARALPLRARAVDVAVCSLVLHHLTEEGVVSLLRTLADAVRVGFVVSDLRRSRLAWAAAWLVTRGLSRNRLTRHDGPLSVRRAYTPDELAALAGRAGLPGIRWRRAAAFRVLGVWTREADGGRGA